MTPRAQVLVACTVGNAVSMTPAVHAVFGTFLMPLSAEFGWPRAAISVVLTIMALTGAIAYPLAGRIADARGARVIVLPAIAIYAVAIAALALNGGSLWRFYAIFLIASIAGSVVSTPIFSKVVADWFDRGRGTALGISAGLGNAIGAVAFPVLAAVVVGRYGSRMGYGAIGLTVLAIGLPTLALWLRDAPRTSSAPIAETAAATDGGSDEEGVTLGEAVRRPLFWLLAMTVAAGAGCTTAIFSHVVPILAERGHGVEIATSVLGVFAFATSGWQMVCGRVLDRVQNPRIAIPMIAAAVAGLALLDRAESGATLLLAGLLLGIGMGTQYGVLPYFVGRYFGTRGFGAIVGSLYSAVIAVQGITPVLLDHAYDVQGSYRAAVLATCAVLVAGTALLLALPRYPGMAPAGAAPRMATTVAA